ncbi:hypothetical protein [Hymenobacter guriensis]|uniref:PH domain-containing protein n=1 Tax=Hymenobacter guriensis TaxID=2793065 RepID=A0ABS0KWL8_9BACT|nr:hypothetical protein [Hymenobacter guriensis]MBG8552259.1 hypothetical protein [Hymenobacter guriensis]
MNLSETAFEKIIWACAFILFIILLLNVFTGLEIRFATWVLSVTLLSAFLFLYMLDNQLVYKLKLSFFLFVLWICAMSFVKGIMAVFAWQTQTILYQNIYLKNRIIEFQMMNPGAGSYRRRTVEKTIIVPGINWITEINGDSIDLKQWKKFNIDINELGLKYV